MLKLGVEGLLVYHVFVEHNFDLGVQHLRSLEDEFCFVLQIRVLDQQH